MYVTFLSLLAQILPHFREKDQKKLPTGLHPGCFCRFPGFYVDIIPYNCFKVVSNALRSGNKFVSIGNKRNSGGVRRRRRSPPEMQTAYMAAFFLGIWMVMVMVSSLSCLS